MPQHCHVCPVWIAKTFDTPLRRLLHKPEVMFKDYVKPGMTALDLGCGYGFFSFGLAKLVGSGGTVYAADIQQGMLDGVLYKTKMLGLDNRIKPVLVQPESIGVDSGLDFALAFWMLHETPDVKQTLESIYKSLKTGGVLFLAEPKFHVKIEDFRNVIKTAEEIGYSIVGRPEVKMSHAVILVKN
jgi:ubiquinone/menaquinone biosynthesis C-methylase UbiE